MQHVPELPNTAESWAAADDLAPVNRFYVTLHAGDLDEPVTRGVEVLRQAEYHRCESVCATVAVDDDRTVAVTGFSFRGYDEALANARWLARRLWDKGL